MGGDGDGGDGVDLISGLSDKLLVRILELVPDARDVVRTHALSRRWRGVWTHVAALHFTSDSCLPAYCREARVAEQYVAFVDGALALRAESATARCHAAVEDLEISLDIAQSDGGHEIEELVTPSFVFKAVRGWMRYAVQHEVKSLVLHLNYDEHLLPKEDDDGNNVDYDENVGYDQNYDENVDYDDEDYDENVDYDEYYDENVDNDEDYDENVDDDVPAIMDLDDLASSAKLETMHLKLGGAKLGLLSSSSTAVFCSLTDVSLEDIFVASHLLSRLVSPSYCPHLRKLRLNDLHLSMMEDKMEELLLEGDTLMELSLRHIWNMRSLELRTPSLQVLRVENCINLGVFTVSAPVLEDLMFEAHNPLRIIDVEDHLSSVGTLKIHLYSHGDRDGEDSNNASIDLLQCCRLTKCLDVSLTVLEKIFRKGDIIKGRIPSLPHVTSLTVQATMQEPHSFGASIASFLAQCNNFRYLSLKFDYKYIEKDHYLCGNSCQWKSREFSLAHLQEVEFDWLIGTDCELQFIQYVLARETRIQKVTVSFNPGWWLKDNEDTFKLLTPLLDGGSWAKCNTDSNLLLYKWRRYCLRAKTR